MPLTTNKDALLAAIALAPGDDAPRLIFCDWLEEHGRQALAGFLRRALSFRAPIAVVRDRTAWNYGERAYLVINAHDAYSAAAETLRHAPWDFGWALAAGVRAWPRNPPTNTIWH